MDDTTVNSRPPEQFRLTEAAKRRVLGADPDPKHPYRMTQEQMRRIQSDEEAPRYVCGRCMDEIYRSRPCPGWHWSVVRHREKRPCSGCSTMWFCDACDAGRNAEARYWFDRLYVRRGQIVIFNERHRTEFEEYVRVNQFHGDTIRKLVNALREGGAET